MSNLSMPAGSGPSHPTSRVEGRAASLEAEEPEIYILRIECQKGAVISEWWTCCIRVRVSDIIMAIVMQAEHRKLKNV